MAYKRINQIYFLADAVDDLATISTEIAPEDPMGLECYVITEACEYKALSTGEWIKQVIGSNSESVPADYITEEELKKAIEQIKIPSVTGLASEEYVDEAISNITIPSVEGLASEEYVNSEITKILSNPIFKTFEDTAIAPENNQFGIYLEAKENKTLIEAMKEKGLGLYNFWVGKGAPGLPAEVLEKNASCRGICCVDVFRSETNWYGWIIMFDHDSDMYVQYIRNTVPTGWKKIINEATMEKEVKYDFTNLPDGTIIDFDREKEVRIFCPEDAVYTKQQVGEGGDPNMYYMTFTSYAPEGAVALKEGDRGTIVDELIPLQGGSGTGVDEFGRGYKKHWFALASYDESSDTWTYFGKNSTTSKYIGWTYIVEWYDANDKLIDTDKIRINLSNKDCHLTLAPYYGE